MYVTWEDRKQRGRIDNHTITEKPALSFTYAWLLVTDTAAQYVESHEYGYWNKGMTPEQRQEVVDYYNAWTPPAPPEPEPVTLEEAKQRKVREINAAYQNELSVILSQYPQAETLTWDKQEREARAWSADSSVPTPYVDVLATARSMDKAELVSRIIAKADAWIAASGQATGKRQALEAQIQTATTIEEVEAIQW